MLGMEIGKTKKEGKVSGCEDGREGKGWHEVVMRIDSDTQLEEPLY